MAEPDPRVVDFSQLRVTMLSDTLRDLVEQIKSTNTHVARLTRDIGELRGDMNREIRGLRVETGELRQELGGMRQEMGGLRLEVGSRFDRMQRDITEVVGEQILHSSQILNAQQDARRALSRIEAMLEAHPTGPEGSPHA